MTPPVSADASVLRREVRAPPPEHHAGQRREQHQQDGQCEDSGRGDHLRADLADRRRPLPRSEKGLRRLGGTQREKRAGAPATEVVETAATAGVATAAAYKAATRTTTEPAIAAGGKAGAGRTAVGGRDAAGRDSGIPAIAARPGAAGATTVRDAIRAMCRSGSASI